MKRTFIVEDCAGDDFGQWANDDVASKATLMMRDHVCERGTTLSVPGCPDHSRASRRR